VHYKVFFFQTGQAMPEAAQETPAAVAFSTKQSCKQAKQSPFDKKKKYGDQISFMFILTQKHPRSMEEEQATAQDWTNWPALLSPVSLSSTPEVKPSEAKQCQAMPSNAKQCKAMQKNTHPIFLSYPHEKPPVIVTFVEAANRQPVPAVSRRAVMPSSAHTPMDDPGLVQLLMACTTAGAMSSKELLDTSFPTHCRSMGLSSAAQEAVPLTT
jgi:hypothetical protein